MSVSMLLSHEDLMAEAARRADARIALQPGLARKRGPVEAYCLRQLVCELVLPGCIDPIEEESRYLTVIQNRQEADVLARELGIVEPPQVFSDSRLRKFVESRRPLPRRIACRLGLRLLRFGHRGDLRVAADFRLSREVLDKLTSVADEATKIVESYAS